MNERECDEILYECERAYFRGYAMGYGVGLIMEDDGSRNPPTTDYERGFDDGFADARIGAPCEAGEKAEPIRILFIF